MERPNMPKYVTRSNYTIELEKYCDDLEKEIKKHEQEITKLKKMLNVMLVVKKYEVKDE